MNAKEIYDILRAGGMTRAGALGTIANMMEEATIRLIPNIVQFGTTTMSNEEYTAAVDEGRINFADGKGYGLCQWTEESRKRKLLSYARDMGVSVGDGAMQSYFVIKEMREDFPAVFKTVCSSNNIDECTDFVLTRYEMPAVNNYAERRNNAYRAANEIPEEYTPPRKDPVSATFPQNPSVKMIQYVMWDNGYWDMEKINGYKSKEFFAKLREFTDDMEKC